MELECIEMHFHKIENRTIGIFIKAVYKDCKDDIWFGGKGELSKTSKVLIQNKDGFGMYERATKYISMIEKGSIDFDFEIKKD